MRYEGNQEGPVSWKSHEESVGMGVISHGNASDGPGRASEAED